MGAGGENRATEDAFVGNTCSRATGVVDFVYGLHPSSTTGGCVVQRSFEDDLRDDASVVSVNVHVASDAASAERVFELLKRQQGELRERRREKGEEPASRVLIVDGIALLYLRNRLHELRGLDVAGGPRRILAGFIHCPFSEPSYREEPWLRAVLPEHMLLDDDGAGIRAEEVRLFSLFDKVLAVGAPCRSLLTTNYGVPEEAIVALEPTFAALPPSPVPAADADADADADAVTVEERVGSPLNFVSVGTLCPRKGQLGLIAALRAACARHPDRLGGSVLALIGGDGADPAYTEAVRAAAVMSGADGAGVDDRGEGERLLEVRLLGPLPREETLEKVGSSDVFLLNSCSESWALAPVEAALRGVPVLSTRVGWLTQSLPLESTIWVGQGQDGQGADNNGVTGGGTSLASAADWEKALLRFVQDRRRIDSEAKRAVPGLTRRFGRTVADSRTKAVRKLLETNTGRRTHASSHSGPADSPQLSNGSTSLSSSDAVVSDQERVRRATVTNSFACVCATCVTIGGAGGAAGGLLALVATQCLLLVGLAPPCSPANIVTVFRSFIPPAVVWSMAGSDFGQVSMADVTIFGVLFVLLDVVDGMLARRSKSGPTRVGAALDVESDSIAVLFLSLVASRKAWRGGFIAGVLRYVFVLATGARDLPPSPIGPAGRWFAKVAALASVAALAASIGNGTVATGGGGDADMAAGGSGEREWMQGGAEGSSPFLCAAGVAILCASFSIDFFQMWVLLPREAAAEAAATAAAAATSTATKGNIGNGSALGETAQVLSPATVTGAAGRGGRRQQEWPL